MQTTSNRFVGQVKHAAAGNWLTVFSVLFLGLFATPAKLAAQQPIVVTGPAVQVGIMKFTPPGGSSTGGGWDSGASPVGGTLVIGANGNVIVGDGYGNVDAFEITPSGTQSILAQGGGGNSSAAAIDSYGNVYVAYEYNGNVYKIPYNAQSGAYAGFTTAPTSNCKGGTQDANACVFAPNVQSVSGIAALAFDQRGNFIFATDDNGGTKNAIYVCNAACQAETDGKGTNAPVNIYSDTNAIGAIAADPWGNLFFSDGASGSSGKVSNLQEMVFTAGTGTYASPAVVESYTNSDGYTNGISGVTIGSNGTVYFSTNTDGIFAIPNSSSGLNLSGIYVVVGSAAGSKAITVDTHGNFAFIPYSNTLNEDVISWIPTGSFQLGATAVAGTALTATATIVDSGGSCTPTLTYAPTQFGVASTEYSVTAGSGCSAALGSSNGTFNPAISVTGSVTSATISFVPKAVGMRNATLAIRDSADNAAGTVALSGVGQSEWPLLDPAPTTAYTTNLSSPSSVVADSAGDVFVADAGSSKVWEFVGSNAPVSIGSGLAAPTALAFDANGDLFIGDNNSSGGPFVYEIANTGTTGTFVAGTQQTVISSSTLFNATALVSAQGLAFGPDGTLYIADNLGVRVVTFNPATGNIAVTSAVSGNGLQSPAGIAVDSSSNLYIADSGTNKIFIFSAAGGISSVTPPVAISKASAVAVDASGSLIVGDSQSSNVVWIPNMGGTLSTSNAATIESISPQVSSLWLDSKGDLYAASAFGKGAYAIQRSQGASVNFGSIVDGNSSSATIFFENSGNESTTLSASAITAPGNPLFSLVAASTNPCGNSLSLPAGGYCEMTSEFAPITGTAAGAINTSGAINFSPSISETINLSGTTATSSLPIPTISFTPPSPVLIGQQVNLNTYASDSGSVTSTSPFTFTISPSSPCANCASLSGSTLTALSAGTITITANQAGNSSYAAAAPVAGSITIQAATASGIPALSLNQATFIGDFCPGYCGGFTSGNNPAGGSIAINSLGDVIDGDTYGNNIQIWAPSSSGYTQTTVKNGGAGGAAVDAANNIYASYLYYPQIWKVPFISGAYATTLPATVPNCVGTGGTTPDKTPCLFNPSGLVNSEPGITATTFDTNGNLFFVSEPNTTTGFNGIYMIPAASLTSISNGSVAATPVYTADPYTISSITLDANNSLFFTDSNFCSTNTNPCAAPTSINSDLSVSESSGSNLYELASSGGAYSGTPVLLQSFADSTPGNYDNALSGVAADRTNGIVYFSTIQSGIWAFANSGTPFTSSSLPTFYAVAGPNGTSSNATNMTGGKGLAVGAPGTLYAVGGDSTSDDLYMLTMGSATAPLTPLNTTSTTSAVVVDNAFGCGKAATLAISSTNPVFAATGGATCASIAVGSGTFSTAIAASSSYPASITFSPLVGGSQTSTLSISDTANGGTGSATITGVGQETPQTITIASIPTQTYSPGLQLTLSATGGGSNNPITFTIDASSTGTGVITGNTLTVTQAGSIVLDANQSGGLVNGVFYEAAPQVQLSLTINKATQTISFAPPSSPVTYAPGLTVTLNATGGASGSAIVFSVDSSSTGNGTISGNSLTVTQAGNIVIDANQTGNVDYLPAIQMQQTLVVNQAAQSITFVPITQPFHYIASGGATLAVQAAGGPSNQPIVFAVDASSTMKGSFSSSTVSGATSTATVTLPAQTATSGTIVIDATQPGNSNYSAAAQVQETINVLAPLPTQTITFNNPGTQVVSTPLSLKATASSGFPVNYAAAPSSICTVAQSGTTWSATFVATGNCSITASQPGDNLYYAAAPSVTQTFIVNPKGQVPAMALDFSSSTINMQPGTNGLTQLTIGSTNNFTGQVSFACSGLPTGYTCTFNPNPISVAAGGSATTTLTVNSSSTAALHREQRPFYPVTTLAVALCLLGFRKRNRLYMLLLVAVSIIGFGLLNGCGGSSSASLASQVKSTSVTVTATSGSVQQTTTLTILVE